MQLPRGLQRIGLTATAILALAGSGCLSDAGHLVSDGPAATLAAPANVPSELNKIMLPPYVIEAPDILLIEVYTLPRDATGQAVQLSIQPITGQHLVRPDGTVNMGIWGSLSVSGLTTEQTRDAVRRYVFNQMLTAPGIKDQVTAPDDINKLYVAVDVIGYNSKAYYVITDGAGYGEKIDRFPIQGHETVLDALSNINGLPAVGSKSHIWVARRTPHAGQPEQHLQVDYVAVTQDAHTPTNYQIMPGDRVYVRAEKVFLVDNYLQKMLAPIERVLGITLLGSSSYNQIANRGLGSTR